MAGNLVKKDGRNLHVTVGSGIESEDVGLIGSHLPFVALTSRDSTSGKATVDLGPGVYDLSVVAKDGSGNSAVSIGDALFWDTTQSPDSLSKNKAGVFFGYALEAIDSGETETINVLKIVSRPPVGGGQIENDGVSVEHLDDGILPSHVVKFAGNYTVPASPAPDTTTEISCVGIADTDVVIAAMKTNGGSPKVNILSYAITASPGSFTLTTDTAPTAEDVISYMVLRAAA